MVMTDNPPSPSQSYYPGCLEAGPIDLLNPLTLNLLSPFDATKTSEDLNPQPSTVAGQKTHDQMPRHDLFISSEINLKYV